MSNFFEAIKNVSTREIKKIIKTPIILVVLFLFPLVACFILASTFVAGSPKDLPIGVLDLDNSKLTRKIVRMVDATPACSVKYRVDSLEDGRKLIAGGQIYAFLAIPRGFTRDLYRMKRPQLVYYYNNNLLLVGGIVTKDVTTAVQTALAGADVLIQMKHGIPKDIAVSRVNLIRVDEHVRSNPYLNYSFFLSFAAFAHIFQVLIAFLSIWTVGVEFKEGTTKEWLECAQNSILAAVFGKLFVYGTCFLITMILIYSFYILGYGAPFEGNLTFLIFGTVVFIFAYQLTGIMFVSITSNLRLSYSCGAFYTSLGFTMAGMTFPNMAMPAFGRFYSALLPLRPYVAILVDQTMRGFAPKYDMGYIYWMCALASLGVVTLPLLKKHAQDEKLWYKL